MRSFAYNERTSLELVDQNIHWNDNKKYWYTDWFSETKILGDEDQLAVRSLVVDEAKEPAALVAIDYDKNGNGNVDATSDTIELGKKEEVKVASGIPIDEGGYYRLRIMEYSGYNSVYAINTAIIH
jgi:hypothetical protein